MAVGGKSFFAWEGGGMALKSLQFASNILYALVLGVF
jgi:hypothetical protein